METIHVMDATFEDDDIDIDSFKSTHGLIAWFPILGSRYGLFIRKEDHVSLLEFLKVNDNLCTDTFEGLDRMRLDALALYDLGEVSTDVQAWITQKIKRRNMLILPKDHNNAEYRACLAARPKRQPTLVFSNIMQDWNAMRRRPSTHTYGSLCTIRFPTIYQMDCSGIKVRMYEPINKCEQYKRKIVVWLHGGGYALGRADSEDSEIRRISEATGLRVCSVEYRLAPEHPLPAALEDCQTVIKYWSKHCECEVLILEVSSGGHCSLAMAMWASANDVALAGVVAIAPMVKHNARSDDDLRRKHAIHSDLTIEALSRYQQAYGGTSTPDLSLLTEEQIQALQLPPVLIISFMNDILLGEQNRFVSLLLRGKKQVYHRKYRGAPHASFVLGGCMPQAWEDMFRTICRFFNTSTIDGGKPYRCTVGAHGKVMRFENSREWKEHEALCTAEPDCYICECGYIDSCEELVKEHQESKHKDLTGMMHIKGHFQGDYYWCGFCEEIQKSPSCPAGGNTARVKSRHEHLIGHMLSDTFWCFVPLEQVFGHVVQINHNTTHI